MWVLVRYDMFLIRCVRTGRAQDWWGLTVLPGLLLPAGMSDLTHVNRGESKRSALPGLKPSSKSLGSLLKWFHLRPLSLQTWSEVWRSGPNQFQQSVAGNHEKRSRSLFPAFCPVTVCSSNISSISSMLKMDVMKERDVIRNHDLGESGLLLYRLCVSSVLT